jgi:hypothetical protein
MAGAFRCGEFIQQSRPGNHVGCNRSTDNAPHV